ncbi:MAG: CapA family protein, partial [Oscillospiraceae bacterium]|nr:CapA family protein [Oscillospiraceae bacterium]
MSDIRETGSLEEQLRQDQRREAARRRRKRLPWMIPLALLAVLLGVGLYLLISNQNPKTPRTAETEAPANSPVTIAFVGDIAMTKAAQEAFQTPAGYDFSPCFRWVTAELRAADLAVGNLEGNISDEISDYNYPPALLTALYDAGFDVLQTANSFSVVNGVSGLARTKAAISSAGLRSVGTSATKEEADQTGGVLVQDVNGIRFAFLAFTKGMENNLRVPEEALWSVNLLYSDELYKEIARDAILNAVKRARAENPDVIVALVHWGSEYDEELSDSQTKIAELLLENGVSLVVGSHSHYVGPVKRTNGYG